MGIGGQGDACPHGRQHPNGLGQRRMRRSWDQSHACVRQKVQPACIGLAPYIGFKAEVADAGVDPGGIGRHDRQRAVAAAGGVAQ